VWKNLAREGPIREKGPPSRGIRLGKKGKARARVHHRTPHRNLTGPARLFWKKDFSRGPKKGMRNIEGRTATLPRRVLARQRGGLKRKKKKKEEGILRGQEKTITPYPGGEIPYKGGRKNSRNQKERNDFDRKKSFEKNIPITQRKARVSRKKEKTFPGPSQPFWESPVGPEKKKDPPLKSPPN